MWTKHKDNKAKDQTNNNSVSADPEQDITYSIVRYTRETAQQAAEPDDNVVYSSLALQVTTLRAAAA
ncbi:unnamed protein product [Coregonus sp. 'balchen']|nr:unnamed protein product [Coregonus sp. 'balchen']